jgi:hypothetical protein
MENGREKQALKITKSKRDPKKPKLLIEVKQLPCSLIEKTFLGVKLPPFLIAI